MPNGSSINREYYPWYGIYIDPCYKLFTGVLAGKGSEEMLTNKVDLHVVSRHSEFGFTQNNVICAISIASNSKEKWSFL